MGMEKVGLLGYGVNAILADSSDFTTLFEDGILNLLPAACFIILSSSSILRLWRKRQEMMRQRIFNFKIILAGCLVIFKTISLALITGAKDHSSRVAFPAALLELIMSMHVFFLVQFEYYSSISSLVACLSLFWMTMSLDIGRACSAFIRSSQSGWMICLTSAIVIKVAILVMEIAGTRQCLLEETSSEDQPYCTSKETAPV